MKKKETGVLLTDNTGCVHFVDDVFLEIGRVANVHTHILDLMEEFNTAVRGAELMNWIPDILASETDEHSLQILLTDMRIYRLSVHKYGGSRQSYPFGVFPGSGRAGPLWVWELSPVWFADSNRLPAWINTAPAGIWIVSMSDRELRYMNDYAVELYGYPRSYWYYSGSLQAKWEAQIYHADRPRLLRMAHRFLTSETTEGMSRHRILDAGGTVRSVEERYMKITDENNRVTELIGSVVDVSGQAAYITRLESLLKKREEVNKLRTNLIRLLAHEFRTPLTVLQNSSERIKTYLSEQVAGGGGDQVIRKNSARIHRQVSLMNRILKNVSLYGDQEVTGTEIRTSEFDLLQLVRELAGDIGDYQGRNIGLELPSGSLFMQADPNSVKIILSNLITNACKYSPGARDPRIYVTPDMLTRSVRIEVVDYGIGIPEKDRKQIFDYFFRSENTHGTDGFGVGLSIAREMVILHNGDLNLVSREGEGSRFIVHLPLRQPQG